MCVSATSSLHHCTSTRLCFSFETSVRSDGQEPARCASGGLHECECEIDFKHRIAVLTPGHSVLKDWVWSGEEATITQIS